VSVRLFALSSQYIIAHETLSNFKQMPNKSEPLILALDTSSRLISIALARGHSLIASFGSELGERCSERLWVEINSLLGNARLKLDDVDLFSVCIGPGRFTGLRIGIAAVKGLAMATDRLIVGSSSLEAIAFAAGRSPLVCTMIDAHRGEIYWQLFSFDEDGIVVANGPAMVSTLEAALRHVSQIESLVLCGEPPRNSSEIKQMAHERGWLIKPPPELAAEALVQLAYLKLSRGHTTTAAQLQAFYVRPAEAEVKLSSRR
jgi:tRNA threonylcarbamoyladenosine biosynthesis protein TsaB